VSAPSFYQWRRKLRGSSTGKRSGKPTPSSAFRSVALVTPGHVVSVTLADGTRIEIPSESTEAVRAVVGELARTEVVRRSGESSC
ncbi:MAG: hypothetical protein ACR2NM_01665, partial [Bythopirellula sp.]